MTRSARFLAIGIVAVLLVVGAWMTPRLVALSDQVRGSAALARVGRAGMGVLYPCLQEPVTDPEQTKYLQQAVTFLESAFRRDPRLAQAYLMLGEARCLAGEYQEAVQAFQEYTRLRPQNPLGHLQLGFAYAAEDASQSPLTLLTQAAASLAAWKPSQQMTLAVAEWQAGGARAEHFRAQGNQAAQNQEPEAALGWYEYALWMQIDAADTWLAVGDVQQSAGEADQALQAYRLAWNSDPALATERYAAYLESQGALTEAETVLTAALEAQPQAADRLLWWTRLGRLLTEAERWADAQQVYRSAMAEYPAEPGLSINLGWALYNDGQGVQASLEAFEQAIALAPGQPGGYYAAGLLLGQESRFAEAADYYAQAVASSPGEKWYHLVWANALRSAGDLPGALVVYEETLVLFPLYAQAHYEIAWAYHLAGNTAQAQAAIQQALALMSRPDAWYYLRAGLLFEAAGKMAEAVTYYQQALAIDASIGAAQQALERLNQP